MESQLRLPKTIDNVFSFTVKLKVVPDQRWSAYGYTITNGKP